MALPPEVQTWLNNAVATAKAAGIPDDKLSTLQEVFSQEKVADFAKQSVHAASDYSRKMDALRNQEQILTNYEARLGAWKSEVESKLSTAEERARLADEYAQKLKAAQDELARLKQDGYTDFNVDTLATKPSSNGKPASQSIPFTEEVLNKKMEDFLAAKAPEYAMLPAIINDITREHQRLFGELPEMQPLISKALKLGQPLVTTWESEYKVQERRQQIAKEREDEVVNRRVEEALSKERSNLSMQGQSFRAGDPRSPVLTLAARQVAAPSGAPPAPTSPAPIFNAVQSEGVKEALEAYNKGTYQVKFPGQS